MAGKKDRVEGKAREIAGAARKKVGQVLGNEQMQVEGAVEEVKGKAQGVVGEVKSKLAKKID